MAKLTFSKGIIEDLGYTPNEEGLKCVLVLSGKLSYDSACKLMVEDMLFNTKKMARAFTGSIGLPKGVKDAEVALPGTNDQLDVIQCDVPKLSVEHAENADDDDLRIKMRLHFTSNQTEILDFVMDKRKAEFKFELRKRQADLFEDQIEEPETGKAAAAKA
jgi:hypothetical protein